MHRDFVCFAIGVNMVCFRRPCHDPWPTQALLRSRKQKAHPLVESYLPEEQRKRVQHTERHSRNQYSKRITSQRSITVLKVEGSWQGQRILHFGTRSWIAGRTSSTLWSYTHPHGNVMHAATRRRSMQSGIPHPSLIFRGKHIHMEINKNTTVHTNQPIFLVLSLIKLLRPFGFSPL